jgi:glycosyltransferase involved in cell wall biosynthesis
MSGDDSADRRQRRKVNVHFQQPALPDYRFALYERLTSQLPLRITVHFDTEDRPGGGSRQHSAQFESVGVRDRRLLGGRLLWSQTQIRLVRAREAEIVVLSWNSRYLSLPFALLVGRMRRTPVLLWGHGYSRRDGALRRVYRNGLGRLATKVLVYSQGGADRLPKSMSRRAVVVGNALFREVASVEPPRSPETRSKTMNVIHVGRLRQDRRVDLVIQSIAILRAEGWDARLTIVGDGPARPLLERTSSEQDVTPYVHLVGATRDERSLGALYGRADVATLGAAGGLGVLDALERGLPVVLAGFTGHGPEADIVLERFPELVDSTMTAHGLAACLERARTSPQVARAMRGVPSALEQGRADVIRGFAAAFEVVPAAV